MIHRIRKATRFRAVLNASIPEGVIQEVITGNMDGRTPAELAAEFKMSGDLNATRRPVLSASISLAPGETLDRDQWRDAVDTYIHALGFTSNQYIAFRPIDTNREWVHIVASRIRLDTGKLVPSSHEFYKGMTTLRKLEKEYGLKRPGVVSGEKERAL